MFLYSLTVKSQSIHFKHLDMEDGLSSNQVYAITRDHVGFLILGTEQGLCKYDGREVSLIKQKGNSEFEKLKFLSLYKDDDKNVWIGSAKGLFIRNESGDVQTVEIDKKEIGIRKVIPYHDSILIYTNSGWYISDKKNKKPVTYEKLNILTKGKSLSDLSIREDRYLIGVLSEKSVIKIDLKVNQILFEKPIELINTAAVLHDGNIACGAGTGFLYILDGNSGKVIKQFESTKILEKVTIHKSINHLREISNGRIAFTTEDDGFYILDSHTSLVNSYHQNFIENNNISSDQSVLILKDEEENVYITTLYNGIDFFNEGRYFVERKETFTDGQHNMFNSYTNSIVEDKNGKLWIGVTDRVIEYDAKSNFTKYHYHHAVLGKLRSQVNTLLGFKTVCIDKDGKIWKGSFKGGIIVYNPATKKKIRLTKYGHQGGLPVLPASYIWYIMQDAEGMMWAATNYGVVKINPFNYKVDTLNNDVVLKKLPKKRTKYIFEDSKNRMWFGTHTNGVYRYDEKDGSLIQFKDKQGIAAHCYQIKEDRHGNIYIAHDDGFSIIDNNDVVKNYNTKNGLRNRLTEDFLFTDDGYVYIANHNTILRFNPSLSEFKYYDEYFGIGGISFKSNTALATKDGNMIFGTEKGFLKFDPKKLDKDILPKKLTIYDVTGSSGIKYNLDNISITNDEALTFNFTFIDLFGSKNIYFQYKLEGLNNQWVDIGTDNTITFNLLPRGNFKLKLRATINNIDWINAEQQPIIKVRLPIYKNPIVYFSLAFVLLFLAGLWIYQRLRAKHREALLNQQITEFQVTAIRAQMNPHFVFNALNSIQYFVYSGEVDKANEYLTDFSKLMRLILQQSKNSFITLENEIEILSLYIKIEALRFTDDFQYKIIVDDSTQEQLDTLMLPSMIIQPFVENAIKHGLIPKKGKKELILDFVLNNDILTCKVIDNGIGIEASKELQKGNLVNIPHESMGMALVRKRLENYGKNFGKNVDLIVNSNNEQTEVIIKMPSFGN